MSDEFRKYTTNLVTKAFVLEALTDKPGCTTRYGDLPGLPLTDFIIADINAAPYLQLLVDESDSEEAPVIFKHFPSALRASNQHKSQKTVNFGLLEIMFPTVYARLQQPDPTKVVGNILDSMRHNSNQDVRYLLEAREFAWQSSGKNHKKDFPSQKYAELQSVNDFYAQMIPDYGSDTSHHQWAVHYQQGLPVLQAFFDTYCSQNEIMQTTKSVYITMREKYPDMKVGIIADMCAAAIFLWLSYHDNPVE